MNQRDCDVRGLFRSSYDRERRKSASAGHAGNTVARYLKVGVIAIWSLCLTLPCFGQTPSAQETTRQVALASLTRYQLPAVAVYVQSHGRPIAKVALGVRKLGDPTAITTADLWHIGSCTKAMTATTIARLVDRGLLSFDAKMTDLFPGFVARMNSALRNATLAQMLSHTAGLGDIETPDQLKAMIGEAHDLPSQRRALARYVLARSPEAAPGTRFKYSNLGFVIAAAAAEARTHRSWETLIRQEVFIPLHMSTAGFGSPGVQGRIEQPYGHIAVGAKLTPIEPDDSEDVLPPALSPAGGVHVSLADWIRFAQDQTNGALGHGELLKSASYRRIQTPVAPSKIYGMGWGVKLAADGSVLLLTHNGSTDPWFAEIRAFPPSDLIILVATNRGDENGGGAGVKEIGKKLANVFESQR
jgi:D-alanyl-D-alanine carboxypeptidase